MAAFEDYPVRSVATLLAGSAPQEENEYLQKPGDRYFEAGVVVAKSRLVCSAGARAISDDRQTFLRQYFQGRRQPQMAELFREELPCREGFRKYWLPIQAPLMSYFLKEVSPGKPVDLYIMFIGSFRSTSSDLIHVFAINEFSVVPEGAK